MGSWGINAVAADVSKLHQAGGGGLGLGDPIVGISHGGGD